LTHGNKRVEWWKNNTRQYYEVQKLDFRQNVYYWFDYDNTTKTGKVYYSITSTKPALQQHSYTDFTFDTNSYCIGFGAATGAKNDFHILKSFKLTFS
jgi:hypothetical protein